MDEEKIEAELKELCALYEEADGAPPGTHVAEWREGKHSLELHVHPAGGPDAYAFGSNHPEDRARLVAAMLHCALRRTGRCQLCRAKAGRENLGLMNGAGFAKYRCAACNQCFWEQPREEEQ